MIFLFRNVGNGKAAEPEQSGTIRYQGRFFSVVWVLRASPCRIRQFCQCHCPSSHFHSCPHSDTIGRFGGFTCLFFLNQEVNSFIFGHICIFNFLFFFNKEKARRRASDLIYIYSSSSSSHRICFVDIITQYKPTAQFKKKNAFYTFYNASCCFFSFHPCSFFSSSTSMSSICSLQMGAQ